MTQITLGNRNKLTDTENKLMFTIEEGGEGARSKF